MTIPTEVAAVLAEMRELKVPNWPAGRILGDLADRLESALTKAEAPARYIAEGPEGSFFTDDPKLGRAILDAYNEGRDWTFTDLGDLTGEQSSAVPVKALDAERYRLLRRGQHWSVVNGIGDTLRAEELDAAIDRALYAHAPPAVPVESLGRDADYPECSGDPASCPENEGHGCCKPNPVRAPAEPVASVPDGWRAALEESLSVVSSVSMAKDRRVVREGEILYLQTEEWCKWLEDEVKPMIEKALAAATNQEGAAP